MDKKMFAISMVLSALVGALHQGQMDGSLPAAWAPWTALALPVLTAISGALRSWWAPSAEGEQK